MFLLSLLTLLIPAPGQAFRLEPMVVSVPVTEPRAAGTYSVENTTGSKVAVTFQMKERRTNAEGQEERPPAEGFLIYPPQLQLEPGEKRSVRVSWSGAAVPKKELAFRLVASQLPLDFDAQKLGQKPGTNIKFLLEYVASFYLVPAGVSGRLRVAKQSVNEKGELEILVKNEGTAHELLEKLSIEVEAGAKKFRPPAAAIDELRTGNILAGEERILRVALPKGFPKDARAKVRFRQ